MQVKNLHCKDDFIQSLAVSLFQTRNKSGKRKTTVTFIKITFIMNTNITNVTYTYIINFRICLLLFTAIFLNYMDYS